MSINRMSRTACRALAVLVVALLVACGQGGTRNSAATDGPLGTPSDGGQPAVDTASIALNFGQTADGGIDIVNSAEASVRITAISLVPINGEPDGRLVHVAIIVHGSAIGADRSWPPEGIGKKFQPAIGANIPPGVSQIVIGITGMPGVAHYAVAGARIDYVYRGAPYTTIAWDALAACFEQNGSTTGPSCSAFGDKVNWIFKRMVGLS